MALKSIEEEWAGYSKMVFRKCNPSAVQIMETKQAFFAAAFALTTAMSEIGEPHISEAEGVRYLENVQRECVEFYQSVMKRYAETN